MEWLRSAIATMPGRKLPVSVSAELVGLAAALGARVKAGGGGDSTSNTRNVDHGTLQIFYLDEMTYDKSAYLKEAHAVRSGDEPC